MIYTGDVLKCLALIKSFLVKYADKKKMCGCTYCKTREVYQKVFCV